MFSFTTTTTGAVGCSVVWAVVGLDLSTLEGSQNYSCLGEDTSFFKTSSCFDCGLRALHSRETEMVWLKNFAASGEFH